jgi:hypothetical protein
MDYGKVVRRAWEMVWRYRTLWIFGALLALTTVNGVFFGTSVDRERFGRGVPVIINERSTIYLPGEGVSVDLSAPDGPTITVDGTTFVLSEYVTEVIPREISEIPWFEIRTALSDVGAILISVGIVLVVVVLLSIIVRYASEAALIRAVNDIEESGHELRLRQALRLGWSRSAWRLFLIDLVVRLPLSLAFVILYVLALTPMTLWISGSAAAGVFGTIVATGLFVLVVLLRIAVRMALSLLMQVIRRACALEGLGVMASIRRGWIVVRDNLGANVVMWIIWIGMRLAWMVAVIPIMVILFPVTLIFILGGAVLGGVPALVIGGALTPILSGPVPWIVGAVAGLPIFVVVTMVPMLLVSGWVEILKSSTWTLAYRELRAQARVAPAGVTDLDSSRMEAAPVR